METVNCNEVIGNCAWHGTIDSGNCMICDYLGKTGERRGCKPTECDKYILISKKAGKSNNANGYVPLTPQTKEDDTLMEHYKMQAIKTAKYFGYGEHVIKELKNAKSDREISRILNKARKNKFK